MKQAGAERCQLSNGLILVSTEGRNKNTILMEFFTREAGNSAKMIIFFLYPISQLF